MRLRLSARPPLVCAHACTVDGGSPNTLAGLEQLLDASIEMVELDVRVSGDGVLTAHHDDRLPDGRRLRQLSYDEIASAYPAQAQPARVEELLQAAAGRTRLDLDLKETGGAEAAVDLAVDLTAPDALAVTTLDAAQVRRLKKRHPQVAVGLSLNRSPASFLYGLGRARRCHADLLAIHQLHLRTPLPARASAHELPLFVWTVDDDAQLARVIRDRRVACVITGRPARARELREAADPHRP